METKGFNKVAVLKAARSFYYSGWLYRNNSGVRDIDYKIVGVNFNGEISYHTINSSTESVCWGHYGFGNILEAVEALKAIGSYEPIGAFDASGDVVWIV